MARGRKPGSKNRTTKAMSTKKIQRDTENVENVEEMEVVDTKKEIRETVISCVDGDSYCVIYTNQIKWRNFCKKMLEEHPEDCTLIREYPEDGTIEIKMPIKAMSYIKYPTKREMTEEQRDIARERMKKAREIRFGTKE